MASVWIGPTVGAGIAIGGSSGDVQYNNAGELGGFGDWDGSLLTVPGSVSAAAGVQSPDALEQYGSPVTLVSLTYDDDDYPVIRLGDASFGFLDFNFQNGLVVTANNSNFKIGSEALPFATGWFKELNVTIGDVDILNGGVIATGALQSSTRLAVVDAGYDFMFKPSGTDAIGAFLGNGTTPAVFRAGGFDLTNGTALRGSTTTAQTYKFQVYDNDTGPAYVDWATITNGNTPSVVIAPPAGGTTIEIQATTYKSSDGTSGATAGPFSAITSIQVKNGLVTTLTGT